MTLEASDALPEGLVDAMLALLAVLLSATCLDNMGLVEIPSWAALCWIALSGLVVYRNVVGLGLYDDGPEDGHSGNTDIDAPN